VSDPDRVADAAVQLERTMLAWRRTALSLALNGALFIKAAAEGSVVAGIAAVGAVVVAGGVWLIATWRYRALRGTTAARVIGHGGTVALTVLVAAVAVLALIVVLDPPHLPTPLRLVVR